MASLGPLVPFVDSDINRNPQIILTSSLGSGEQGAGWTRLCIWEGGGFEDGLNL